MAETPYEFACNWYQPKIIWKSILRAHANNDKRRQIPADTLSYEFAEWLTEEYRLAMRKGIELGRKQKWVERQS